MSFRRALPFILLNILISAATMLIVLAIWEAAHRIPVSSPSTGNPTPLAGMTNCTISESPDGASVFTITNSMGLGDLQKEEMDVEYTGIGSFCMNGWQLSVGSGEKFSFPSYFQFYSGGVTIKIYSRAGTNTPLELYWGLDSSILRSGSTVSLLDSHGEVQASYKIP